MKLSAEELEILRATGEIHGKSWAAAVFNHIAALEAELKEARGGIAETYKAYLETHELAMHNLKERDTARQEAALYREALENIASFTCENELGDSPETPEVHARHPCQACIAREALKPEGREP